MALHFWVYGPPGGDNTAYVQIDSGQAISRLLFDCGAGTAAALGRAEVQALDAILFSHLHMDHVAGFDGIFRMLYGRSHKPNRIYGPPRTSAIFQHRFQSFMWNLEAGSRVEWSVFDIEPESISGARFRLGEAFAVARPVAAKSRNGTHLIDAPDYTIDALALDHIVPSLAYLVREKPRQNIDSSQLATLGLRPGAWLQTLKAESSSPTIQIDEHTFDRELLREQLVKTTPGQSLGYCTDFRLDEQHRKQLLAMIHGCDILICESQYLAQDDDLAQRNYHMNAVKAALLAREASVGRLILFHTSDRYRTHDLRVMLAEAQAVFPNTSFPPHWSISV